MARAWPATPVAYVLTWCFLGAFATNVDVKSGKAAYLVEPFAAGRVDRGRRSMRVIDEFLVKAGLLPENVRRRLPFLRQGFAADLSTSQVELLAHHAMVTRLPGPVRGRALAEDAISATPRAWNFSLSSSTTAGSGKTIGFIGSGIFSAHPSFPDARGRTTRRLVICKGYSSRAMPSTTISTAAPWSACMDDVGTGTQEVGVAAGTFGVRSSWRPSVVMSGVAPGARIAVYKVTRMVHGQPETALEDILHAINDAIDDGVDVLHMGAGLVANVPFGVFERAVLVAAEYDVLVVGPSTHPLPPWGLTINPGGGGLLQGGVCDAPQLEAAAVAGPPLPSNPASRQNQFFLADLVAPGDAFLTPTVVDGKATEVVSSSPALASAYAAGVALLMRARRPNLNPWMTASALMTSARPSLLPTTLGQDVSPMVTGAGFVSAVDAVNTTLVFNADFPDWQRAVCSLGIVGRNSSSEAAKQAALAQCLIVCASRRTYGCAQPNQLNLPYLVINHFLPRQVLPYEVRRLLMNTGEEDTFSVYLEDVDGYEVDVLPQAPQRLRRWSTLRLTIKVTQTADTMPGAVSSGALVIQGARSAPLRMPIAVYTAAQQQ